jgi:hypothetical protein
MGCWQLTQACVYGHANKNVLVVGAPIFEARKAAVLLLDATAGGSDFGLLGAVSC